MYAYVLLISAYLHVKERQKRKGKRKKKSIMILLNCEEF